MQGTVKVSRSSADGCETVLAICGPGAIIGEVAALTAAPRSATITALQPVHGLVIAADPLAALLRNHPRLRLRLEQQLAQRLVHADHRRTDAGRPLATARLALLLADLVQQHESDRHSARPLVLPLSQGELASLAAASDSATARALRIMRNIGLVQTGRRSITTAGSAALRAFAEALG